MLFTQVMGGGERVVVSQASVEDAGIYRCLAHNQAGQDTKLIKLEIYSPPRINMSALPSNFVVLSKGMTKLFLNAYLLFFLFFLFIHFMINTE